MLSSLYIHIPYCIQKCDYCDFFSRPCTGTIPDSYVRSLINEAEHYGTTRGITCWKTIYIGGGTPSLLKAEQISALFQGLSSRIGKDTQEVTMEMNPESVTPEKLKAAEEGGTTRLSLGIQSFNEKALKAINRHCTPEKAIQALDIIKEHWTGQLNLDAIAGLPEQNMEQFMDSLERIVSYNPDHISLYTLTVEEDTPLFEKIDKGTIKHDPDTADEQWLKGRDYLESKGYHQYEVSNFAKEGRHSRHNMTYWKSQDYVGIGSGASGTLYCDENIRWTNTQDVEKYMGFWESKAGGCCSAYDIPCHIESLDKDTREFEFLMMGLRTFDGINSLEYEKKFGKSLAERLGVDEGPWHEYSEKKMTLTQKQPDGSTRYALNGQGILFLNNFLLSLM